MIKQNEIMKKYFLLIKLMCLSFVDFSQGYKDGKLFLNENGSHFLKMTVANQIWLRYNDSNPGTTLYGFDKPSTTDIGIRRMRL